MSEMAGTESTGFTEPDTPVSLFPEIPEPERPEAMALADSIAAQFHVRYERLAPEHGYKTREASAVPWDQVPAANRGLMVAVVLSLLDDGVITVADEDLPALLPCCGTRVHYAHDPACQGATLRTAAAPAKPGRLAHCEVKGFRDLGIVRVTESTLAGEPMLRAEGKDGAVAEFPASSLHFITWLPEGAEIAPPARAAIPSGWDDDDDDDLDDDDEYEAMPADSSPF